MSSELHDLIEKELAAADNRIDKGVGASGSTRAHALQVEAGKRQRPSSPGRDARSSKDMLDKLRVLLSYTLEFSKLALSRAKLSYAGTSRGARRHSASPPDAPEARVRRAPAALARGRGARLHRLRHLAGCWRRRRRRRPGRQRERPWGRARERGLCRGAALPAHAPGHGPERSAVARHCRGTARARQREGVSYSPPLHDARRWPRQARRTCTVACWRTTRR
jgi:hypothetical protein